MSTNQYSGGKVIDAAAMGADVTSRIVNIQNNSSVGVQYFIENTPGTSVGVLYVQGSIDGSTFVNLAAFSGSSSKAIASSTDYSDLMNLGELPYSYLRIFFDYTSGADGVMDAWVKVNRR